MLLIVRHGRQQFLELFLGHFLPQLAGLCQCNQAVLDIGCALLLDEADASEAVRSFGVQDLVEDLLSCFFGLSERRELADLASSTFLFQTQVQYGNETYCLCLSSWPEPPPERAPPPPPPPPPPPWALSCSRRAFRICSFS